MEIKNLQCFRSECPLAPDVNPREEERMSVASVAAHIFPSSPKAAASTSPRETQVLFLKEEGHSRARDAAPVNAPGATQSPAPALLHAVGLQICFSQIQPPHLAARMIPIKS